MEPYLDDVVRWLVGGGGAVVLGQLLRSLAARRGQTTASIERAVLLQERIINRQANELEQEQAENDRLRGELERIRHECTDARIELWIYRERFGELDKSTIRRLIGRADGSIIIEPKPQNPDDPDKTGRRS